MENDTTDRMRSFEDLALLIAECRQQRRITEGTKITAHVLNPSLSFLERAKKLPENTLFKSTGHEHARFWRKSC